MRVPRFSTRALQRITFCNIVLLVAVVVSGAIVRLTGSGLGCENWPNCSDTKLVDVSSSHAAVEQLNRIFSGLLGIPLALALIAAYQVRPRRGDLVRLGWLLFGLFWGQAVLGGITVMLDLVWVSVTGHFLLAIALIAIALVMNRRAREPDGRRHPVVRRTTLWVARAVYVLTVAVLVLGTLVTAAGPHGGDNDARRLDYPLGDLARIHAIVVDVLVAVTLVLVVLLVREHAPRRVTTTASVAIAAMAAQGVLGYVQYFNEIPALLVGFHVFGATCVFIAVQQLVLEMRVVVPDNEGNRSVPSTTGETRRVPVVR
jgi:cytochrome c oxidase assembly protein subunit 15